VLFSDCVVGADAIVAGAIVDRHCQVGAGARVGADDADLDDSDQIALLGRDSVVEPGAVVPQGARLEPGTLADDDA
jgi:glucose-1-phosphate adenylyltransferase